jgi:hypothetical protein
LLLVLAFAGILAGVWPALGGATGIWAGAAESTTVRKPEGVQTAPWVTEVAPSISWIHVEVSASDDVEVRVIALSQRRIEISNESGFAAADDLLAIGGGLGEGREVRLSGSHGGPVRYMIVVTIAQSAQRLNVTEENIDYTLTWQVHKLDPLVFLMGLILFGMFFVTEYILSLKRDLKLIARRLERLAGDAGRAPLAALGAPIELPPPVAIPASDAPLLPGGSGGLFGRRGRDVPPPQEVRPLPPPAPAPPPLPYAATAQPSMLAPPSPMAPAAESGPLARPAPSPRSPAAPPPPAPAPPPVAPLSPAQPEPVSRVRCPQCKHIVPVYTAERPTPIKCPNCGKRGMLTK